MTEELIGHAFPMADLPFDHACATGYNRLFRHFGHLGLDLGLTSFWPERGRCLDETRQEQGSQLHEQAVGFSVEGPGEPEAAYVMQSDTFVTQSIERMNLLLDRQLGADLDAGVRPRVEQIVAEIATRQRGLVLAWQRGEIAPEAYLDEFTRLVAADFRRLDQVLGRDAFLAVFGAPPEEAAKVIDPEAFAAAHGLTRPD